MATRKTATKKTTRQHSRVPGSMAERIDSLKVGQSVAEADRFEVGGNKHTAAQILEALKSRRNGLAAYVARITEELDSREFKVESTASLTDDKSAILACAVVTRIG